MKNPQLRRDIQPVGITVEGRQMITFVDPLQLSRQIPAVERGLIPLLEMLDGSHDLRDIQMKLMRSSGGTLVPLENIEAIIRMLDQAFMLESESFLLKKTDLVQEFEGSPMRQAAHAGRSYDADPARLTAFIADAERELPPLGQEQSDEDVAGVMAPHIDIGVALKTYVDVYRRLEDRHYDTVIVFGVNHNGSGGLYCISEKTYVTPLGDLSAEREFIATLRGRVAPGTLTAGDFDHKTEHSIEFQTIFLRHYLQGDFRIVPILCGSIHEFILEGRSPFEDDRFVSMVQALASLIEERPARVLLVAGVDFSHIGPKFGHDAPAERLLSRAQEDDESILKYLEKGEPEELFAFTARTQDRYNVCGLPALLVFSALLKGCRAEVIDHKAYDEQATRSAVTYASMVFARP